MYIDLLIRIKNAQAAGQKNTTAPYSRMDRNIADLLVENGFIEKVEVKGRIPQKILKLYFNTEHPIRGMKILSKPSRSQYSGYEKMRAVKRGYGMLVISTPKGLLSGTQARRAKVGGQLLFEIW
ncbi:MAG TPA: 30S ribosomal protein S8 [Candidatus Jorgensenbacteria bacterium]|uniref:30S ribosomal protein S8 n=1 Tax=marine sediment metagenome TaxID=412755 RepID=A0A0F9B005_9ZZZZ|nr:30S ribosomal protein S8 [Candidatus Jorgensenbacteria bacterium]